MGWDAGQLKGRVREERRGEERREEKRRGEDRQVD
jgi:hypothetical protein